MKECICLDELIEQGEGILYQKLKSLKRDVFPNDYVLEVEYNKDIINNSEYPGKFLSFFAKILFELDIPTFFVKIKTSYKNIDKNITSLELIYKNGKISIEQSKVNFTIISETKDTFCILPWVHFYFNPQGKVMPCCISNENYNFGDYTSGKVDFNNEKIKKFRKNLINNIEVPHCNTCYKKEKNNIKSFRQISNDIFSNRFNKDDLSETVENFKLKFVDVRLSNICNLKCRMCSGKFSNRIAQEEYDIWGESKYLHNSNFLDYEDYFVDLINEHIDSIEYIYFAGGEPLINPNHYKILDLLIEKNNTNLKITYNTNFSILHFKKYNVLEYWKKFSNINVKSSIDFFGKRSNYVRNGVEYKTLEKNYFTLVDKCPNVNFSIDSVLSLYNAFNLCDLQVHWIENIKLPVEKIFFNVLVNPDEMSLKCLPIEFKNAVKEKITNHISFLKKYKNSDILINVWLSAIDFMYTEDHSYMLEKFFNDNDARDIYRNQHFEDYFPEYKNLRSYI